MSKKRLLHGMKRPLALFLALAMALAFVPVVTPTALAAAAEKFPDTGITAVSYFKDVSTIVSNKTNGWDVKDGELSISLEDLLGGDKTPYAFLEIDLTTFFALSGVVTGSSSGSQGFKYKVNKTFGGVTAETEYGLWKMTAGGDESAYTGTWYGDYNTGTFPTTPSSYDGYIVKGTDSKYWLYVPTDLGSATYTITGDGGTVYELTITIELEYEITLSDTDLSGKPVSSTLFSEAPITIGTLGSFADNDGIWDDKGIAGAATAKFNAGYKVTGVSTAKNAALVFKVVDSKGKDVSTSTSLIAVDPADTSGSNLWPTTLWDVLNDKAYIGTYGAGEYNADLSAKMTDLGYTGYWGPAAGRDLADKTSGGSYKYPATGEYDFYFFAEGEDTYTITVGLIDATLGELAKDSVKIEVTNASSLNKTVSIGGISAAITAGTASTVTYPVTTNDIDDGTIGAIKWYDGAATTTSLPSAPTGLTATLSSLYSDKATLEVSATTAVVADTYYFTVTYDGVESEVITLTVEAAPSTSANVATAAELKAAIDTNKTTINVTTSFPTTENVTIPVGTTLNIATSTSLTVANSNTLTMYGTLALADNAKVTIQGTLELSVNTLSNLSAADGAGFVFENGTLKLIANQNATGRLAGLFADADFDLGLYAGAVLNLAGNYGNVDFDWLLSLFSGTGAIAITDGVCGVVNDDVTLPSTLTLDVQDGAALQVESGSTLTADGDIVISDTAEADISGGLTVNGDLTVNGTVEVSATGTLTVANTADVAVNGTVTAASGAKVNLQSDITIAAGGSLDLSAVNVANLTIESGGITIILAPGAELKVPADTAIYDSLSVEDEDGNTLTPDVTGKYEVPEYELTITSATGVGLGVSFKIEVAAGVNSKDLYLIVQSTDEAVSLTMIAVGDYIAAGSGSGYTTHVSYNKTNQVDAWLVKSPTSGVVPDWTAVDTDGCLADDTYTANTP